MDKKIYEQSPEERQRSLREKSNISANEVLMAWLPKVTDEKLIDEYSFPQEILSEIKKSNPYSQVWNVEVPFEMGLEVKKKNKKSFQSFYFRRPRGGNGNPGK